MWAIERLGQLGRAHLGLEIVGGHLRRRDEVALLAGKGFLHAAVEEVGDVRVLLRLGHTELCAPGVRQHRAEDVVEGAWREEDGVWEVVLVAGHGHEAVAPAARALEVGEGLVHQRSGELAGAVGAEVEEEHAVAGPDAVRGADHGRRQKLVGRGVGVALGDVCRGALHPRSSSFRDRPVCAFGARPAAVPVHRVVTPGHRGDPDVAAAGSCARLELLDPPDPRGR